MNGRTRTRSTHLRACAKRTRARGQESINTRTPTNTTKKRDETAQNNEKQVETRPRPSVAHASRLKVQAHLNPSTKAASTLCSPLPPPAVPWAAPDAAVAAQGSGTIAATDSSFPSPSDCTFTTMAQLGRSSVRPFVCKERGEGGTDRGSDWIGGKSGGGAGGRGSGRGASTTGASPGKKLAFAC